MKPSVAVFTRTAPVTKLLLWQCFKRRREGFATVQVDDAHSIIGKNAPRVMERNGYLVKLKLPQGDYYELTNEGKAWLVKGIRSYVRNHPHTREEVPFFPGFGHPEPPPATPVSRRVRRSR